jgi:mRNA interferase MazF
LKKGEVWWAEMDEPKGSEPGYRRPVVIVQVNAFNRSQIRTVVVATITSNMFLSGAPGNVRLSRKACGLDRESVVNVSQIVTLDKTFLSDQAGKINPSKMKDIEDGLRLVLGL